MKKIHWLLFFLCISLSGKLVAQSYYFRHLGIADGLSQVNISAIYQDEYGAVWLGTFEGLNRFNGRSMSVFRPSQGDEGLTNNEINGLCGNGKGTMFIHSGVDLVKLDLKTEKFTCIQKGGIGGMCFADGRLWAGYRSGISVYSEDSAKLQPFASFPAVTDSDIRDILVDKDTVWAVTYKRLWAIPRRHPEKIKAVLSDLYQGQCLLKDSKNNIWVGTWNGVYRLDAARRISHITAETFHNGLSDNQVRCMLQDDFGRIWFGTFRGLNYYNLQTGQWGHYTRSGSSSNTLSHSSVISLYKDVSGNIWVGTYYGGANVFSQDDSEAHFYEAEPSVPGNLSFPIVGRLAEDGKGNIWICTEGGGLNCLDVHTGTFSVYRHKNGDSQTPDSDHFKSIYYRKENNTIYAGTHLGGLFILNLSTGKGHVVRAHSGMPDALPHDVINNIQPYEGGLAIFTQRGPAYFDTERETFRPLVANKELRKKLDLEYYYESFFIDSRQRVWASVAVGGLVCIDLKKETFKYYKNDSKNLHSIGKFKIVDMFETPDGKVFFATTGSGLFWYREESDDFECYNVANGSLPSDYCYYMCNAPGGHRIYVLHAKGVSAFNLQTGKTEETVHPFNQTYSQASSLYRSRNGVIYVGGTNGLASFREQTDYHQKSAQWLKFDRLFVLNKEIVPGGKDGILKAILECTPKVSLSHSQNNLSVEFATFHYGTNQNLMFEYRLDGYDKMWTTTSQTVLTYTSLPPGDYTLRVRPWGGSKDSEIQLQISISSPFYATVWAYLLYFACFVALLSWYIRFKLRQDRLKSSLVYERKEKDRIEELNKLKLRFFTNISHEFRTPLTLILGQLEALLNESRQTPALYNRVVRIFRNAWLMRNLVSQLLDFRKQEQGFLKLRVEEQDLVAFARNVFICFREYAQRKGIGYHFQVSSADRHLKVWFDPVQLQKVIFNLLSNAFKYTPEHGSITLSIYRKADQVCLAVSDTGKGISDEEIYKIFNRFYQAENSVGVGTGIGLALVKGIVDLHHGKIDVESKEGEGSKFIVTLLLGNRHFTDDEIVTSENSDSSVVLDLPPAEMVEGIGDELSVQTSLPETSANSEGAFAVPSADSAKPVILLVDDNKEMLDLLKPVFQDWYQVYVANDGLEAWEMVQQMHPDLVLSDVMMPRMSGKDLCKKIKNSIELSHVSVVLLTAQTTDDNVVEGLLFGADDYVTKPFNTKVLLARCNAIVRNKHRLLSQYIAMSDKSSKTVAPETVLDGEDKELLERCKEVIREKLSDEDLDVTMLADALRVGRNKLYRTLKKGTGLTPGEFILKLKLEEAVRILKTTDVSIKELSVMCGFSSPRYFSRVFKSVLGVVPQEFRKKV